MDTQEPPIWAALVYMRMLRLGEMPTAHDFRKFKVWSNFFYLIPAVVALPFNLLPTIAFSVGVIVFGILHHSSNEKRFYIPDATCAVLLIVNNLILCYVGGFKAPYFWIALMFLGLALLYHFYLQSKSQYGLNHGLWHLYGALITLFSVFTLVL